MKTKKGILDELLGIKIVSNISIPNDVIMVSPDMYKKIKKQMDEEKEIMLKKDIK